MNDKPPTAERSTRQRGAIRDAIEGAGRPLTPQEVQDLAAATVPGLGIATVYRNLKLLVEDGAVQVVALPGESPRYEAAGHAHHHHFQCDACGRAFDVEGCPGDLASFAPPGFSVARHELTLYGTCAECAGKQPKKRGGKAPSATHDHGHGSHRH
jgi:Fur family transcriptional regulator, ferric uptake regulator